MGMWVSTLWLLGVNSSALSNYGPVSRDMFLLRCVSPGAPLPGHNQKPGLIVQLIICKPRVMFETFSLLNGLAIKEFLFNCAGC